ncbi:hypothetical protein [Secundilactobacillus pentosiphilus]|nr:hypothetical protein [Secundilactobacillus pentosiphilus]
MIVRPPFVVMQLFFHELKRTDLETTSLLADLADEGCHALGA